MPPGSIRRETMNDLIYFTVSPLLFETTPCLLDTGDSITIDAITRLGQRRPTVTYISYADWCDFALKTLNLEERTYTSLFDTFYMLSMTVRPEMRVESTRLLLGRMNGEESKYKAAAVTRVVNLPGFVLFLLAQLYLERQETTKNDIITFTKQYLITIVSIVAATKPNYLTQQDVQELGLYFREFYDDKERAFGSSLAPLWGSERMIDINTVAQYIKARLLGRGEIRGISGNIWITGSGSAVQILPNPLGPHPTLLPSFTFRIYSAKQTNFYVPSVLPNSCLTGLDNCVVQLGPVNGILRVDDCRNCVISAICGALIITNCSSVTLFVCPNTPPIINVPLSGGAAANTDVLLAPYNTHYATLEEHIAQSGLNPKLNLWRVGVPDYMLLPPERFVSSSFPIAPQSTGNIITRTNPCPLPREYADALATRINSFNVISQRLQQTYKQLEEAGRRDLADNLKEKVQGMFLDWVCEKGQVRCLVDLLQGSAAGTAQSNPNQAGTL